MRIKERIHTIDLLRGIAIFLVVFGHITHIQTLRTYIWGWHIPIFFFISGFLFKRQKFACFCDFFKSRIKSIVLPYVVFYLVTLVYWILIERHSRGVDVSIDSQLMGLVYGTYDLRYMMFNGALWFIPCLFSIEILYWFISKCINRVCRFGVLIICYAVGLYLINRVPWLPWGVCAAFIGVVFYGLGDFFKPLLIGKTAISLGKYIYIYVIALFLLQLALFPCTGADLASLYIGNKWLYVPIATIGILLYWLIATIIKNNKLLEYLGINSLVIFAFQEPTYRAVIFVVSKISGYSVSEVRNSFLLCIIITICSIIVITPVIVLWNKSVKPLINRI